MKKLITITMLYLAFDAKINQLFNLTIDESGLITGLALDDNGCLLVDQSFQDATYKSIVIQNIIQSSKDMPELVRTAMLGWSARNFSFYDDKKMIAIDVNVTESEDK